MKNLILLLLISSQSIAKNDEVFSLIVHVNNLRNSNGVLQYSLYNKDGSIPDEKFKKYYTQLSNTIINGKSMVVFTNIPKGTYAINVLHDEDKNGKIAKGFIFPKEGIGFSNFDSVGISNRPNFKKASFIINSDTEKTIKIIYF